jgi:hypothetical protein
MAEDKFNPDPNATAARTVAESTAAENTPPADLEAAWLEWSSHIQNVDERGMALLRAAFEAGFEAGNTPDAVALGRLGGQKGGKARAEKLTAEQRSEIAKKAAQARWKKDGD